MSLLSLYPRLSLSAASEYSELRAGSLFFSAIGALASGLLCPHIRTWALWLAAVLLALTRYFANGGTNIDKADLRGRIAVVTGANTVRWQLRWARV